jgi:hypothetical protein
MISQLGSNAAKSTIEFRIGCLLESGHPIFAFLGSVLKKLCHIKTGYVVLKNALAIREQW